MKRLSLIIIMVCLVITATACAKREAFRDKMQEGKGNVRQEFAATPDRILARNIMTIERLKDSEYPLTKEQMEKIKPILNEIMAKETVDTVFAEEKIKIINDILTIEQKESFNRQRRAPQNQGAEGARTELRDGQRQMQDNQGQGDRVENRQLPSPQGEPETSRRNRQNGNFPNIQGFDLKQVCQRVLDSIQ